MKKNKLGMIISLSIIMIIGIIVTIANKRYVIPNEEVTFGYYNGNERLESMPEKTSGGGEQSIYPKYKIAL